MYERKKQGNLHISTNTWSNTFTDALPNLQRAITDHYSIKFKWNLFRSKSCTVNKVGFTCYLFSRLSWRINVCKNRLHTATTYNVLFRYFAFASMCDSLLLFYKELWEGNFVKKRRILVLNIEIWRFCLLNVNLSLEICIFLVHKCIKERL